ncbi:MAG: CoA transferase [Dehalococcoidales bacterium]|jgi:crotonobetainyl-CoA:carnitine CoA-transferase CaiB-like acyl-CoA transferase
MFEKPEDTILAGLSVLDLTDERGSLAVKTLAAMGGEVIRISPETLRESAKTADALIETCVPGYLASLGLGYKELSKINPGLIMASITPFGQDGPYKNYKAYDLTLQAMGGWLSVTGEAETPVKLYGNQAYNTASLFAVNGILLALWRRQDTGRGQHIDISVMECVAATLDQVLVRYFCEGIVSGRQGSRHWNNAFEIFRCRDGYILLSLHQQWETLAEWLAYEGMAEDLADEKWRDRDERNRHIDHVIEVLGRWTLTHGVKELVEKGQLMHFPWAEVVRPEEARK